MRAVVTPGRSKPRNAEASERLDELSPHEVFTRRLAQEELADDLQQALNKRFRGIVASLTEGEA